MCGATGAVMLAPRIFASEPTIGKIAGCALIGAVCLYIAQRAPTYPLFLVAFSGGFGSMSGAIYCLTLAMAARSSAHGTRTPVVVASFGLGGAVFGPRSR